MNTWIGNGSVIYVYRKTIRVAPIMDSELDVCDEFAVDSDADASDQYPIELDEPDLAECETSLDRVITNHSISKTLDVCLPIV